MAIFLDFVGLNTLIHEPISSSVNTIGYENPDTRFLKGLNLQYRYTNDIEKQRLYNDSVTGYDVSNGFSISFWFKANETDSVDPEFPTQQSAYNENHNIILLLNSSDVAVLQMFWNASSESFRIKIRDDSGTATITETVFQSGFGEFEALVEEWNYYTLSWSGNPTEHPSLFVNGRDDLLSKDEATTANDTTLYTISKIWIGGLSFNTILSLNGSIQDLATVAKALTKEEAKNVYDKRIYDWSEVEETIDFWSFNSYANTFYQDAQTFSSNVENGNDLELEIDLYLHSTNNLDSVFVENSIFYSSYNNYSLADVSYNTLAALNIHRNGPYGHASFKQLRSSHNPLTRHHNANSIFSYVLDGSTIEKNDREVFIPKHSALRQIEEAPIASNNKPLTMVGGVSEYNRRTGKTTIERVEVQASPTNEIQFFGDKQANRDFALDHDTHESYEDLTELYLDGGIESDDSPIDQFELLRYQHQVYPREQNSYLEYVRGRNIYWEPGYWKDARNDRTETGLIDNGFGFTIPSQSIWPLDVEQEWSTRALNASIGYLTMSSPSEFVYNATPIAYPLLNGLADGIKMTNYNNTYLWSFAPGGNLTNTYDTSTGEGKFYGKLFGMNSRDGTQAFYNNWTSLMEKANLDVVSTVSSINVRYDVNTLDVGYQDNDPFYMEIDSAAHPYIETELSHSYVHFWTKDENLIDGYVYREMDDNNKEKRSIKFLDDICIVNQTVKYSIISEDGTIVDYLTSSVDDGGGLQFYYGSAHIQSRRGNEWNNNLINFGDPVAEGKQAISTLINGLEVDPVSIVDNLNFFDSNGDINDSPQPYDQSTTIKSYRRGVYGGNPEENDGFLEAELGPRVLGVPQYISIDNINVGFCYRTERTFFDNRDAENGSENDPHEHQIIYYGKQAQTDTGTPPDIDQEGIHIDLVGEKLSLGATEYSPCLRITTYDNTGASKSATYDISSTYDTLTKYLVFDTVGLFYPYLYKWDTSTNSIVLMTPFGRSNNSTVEVDEVFYLNVYDPDANYYRPEYGDELAEIVTFNGSLIGDYDIDNYFNGGCSIDFNSSLWQGPPVISWYRFGNGALDNTSAFFELTQSTLSGPGEIVHDYSGGNRHLYTNMLLWNTKNIPIYTEATTEINNQTYKAHSFHTSSVGEAYVLCATSSTNNLANDYFQNAKIAEFALIQDNASTDLEDYIPLLSTPNNEKLYTFKDLTTTTVTASIWYAFDNSDSITETGTTIQNKSPDYPTYDIVTTYASTTAIPEIDNDGLETGSTFKVKFKARFLDHDTQETIIAGSTAIPAADFVPSTIVGQISDFFIGGFNGYNAQGGAGVLMNSYNSFNIETIAQDETQDIDTYLSAACLYTRRHTLKHSSSFQHPFIAGGDNFFDNLDNFEDFEIYQGMAQWDAPAQAGKKPFYDDYGRYAAEMRLTNKDYTVVPEFKISQHVDKYLLKGDTQFTDSDNALLEVTGAGSTKWNSDVDGFYETYSTTDFLKMFDLIQEEHDDFVNPISLKLKCKGVKKFLPYKGFYPADRTVEISEQFYNSYGDYLTVSSSYLGDTNYAVQNLLTPLFSPGILFNTIKSGVACDYPIMTGSFATSSYEFDGALTPTGTYHIDDQFHKRIPFEALIEPEKYLANQPLYPQEPDPLGDLDMSVTWNGGGDEKYRLMVSNFLAETGEFFLRNKDFASISSLPEGDPNFGNAEAGKTYAMRIKMYRTISGDKALWEPEQGESYEVQGMPEPQGLFPIPQDNGEMEQAFMMYSRPSAFGPPQRICVDSDAKTFRFLTWSEYKKSEYEDYFYSVTEGVTTTPGNSPHITDSDYSDLLVKTHNSYYHGIVGNDSDAGYNYPFTPPYYHGEAWADILYRAQNTEKLTLSQIINSSSVEFLRFYEPIPEPEHTLTDSHKHVNWRLVNEDAMQIASSVNIFSKGVLKQDITQTKRQGIRNDVQVQVDTNIGNQYRWIIQSKFETPILNFNHLNHNSDSVTIPGNSRHTTPIGMWHQYGQLPQNPNEGVFMQVTEIPDQWVDNAMNAKSYQTGSLVELCGFSTDPVRLGDVAPTKTIKEAVVAIPFVEQFGQRQFFTIDREDVQNALEPSTKNLVGKTIQDMVQRMKDYVFPPSMDFINNDDIDPFAMYIFEFKHTLDKQDLADIWQNLPPDIGEYHEEAEAVISHELLAHELLGGKADLKPGRNTEFELNRQVRKDKIDSKIRWMIFKVKQRAKTNYFEKIFARNESQEAGAQLKRTTLSSTGASKNASYNWPYDYFSLVELIKMDAEIDFARPDDENQEEKLVIKPFTKVVSNSVDQTILNNALFGSELPEPEPPQGVIQERIPKGKKRK